MHRPLLLTGAPAAGKSATSLRVVDTLRRAAVIDVDDIRRLVIRGHYAPWEGQEGVRQQRLGVVNACGLARRFLDEGIDVVLSDVLNRDTADLYRQLLPSVLIIGLRVPIAEARRRAALRQAHLTAGEFDALHALQATLDLGVDHIVDVGPMTLDQQVTAVLHLWKS